MTSYRFALAFILLQLAVSPAWAECNQADQGYYDPLFEMSLEELASLPINVASKTPEVVAQAPSSVTVFTRREIQALGVDTVEALLNFVPGFITAREAVFGDGGMVAARGRTTPQASYNILFLRNGQRLNNDRSGGAMTVHRMIPIHDVKRVEVIRGPGSALYGTNAFSGVVNIVTLDDDNRIHGGITSLGGREAYANLSRGGRDWGVNLSSRWFRDDGQSYPGAFHSERRQIRDPRSGKDFFASLCRDGLNLTFQHTQRRQDDFYVMRAALGEFTEFEDNSLRLEYRLVHEISRELTLFAGYRLQQGTEIETLFTSEEMLALPPEINPQRAAFPLLHEISTREEEWGLGLEGYFRIGHRHELSAGIDWRRPDNVEERDAYNYEPTGRFDSRLGVIDYPIQYVGDQQRSRPISAEIPREIFSAYLQDQIAFDERWSATLGARYDRYSDFGDHLSPRLALIYSADSDDTFKLLYGEAFRAPSIRQISGLNVGNRSLEPEISRTLEAAWLRQSRHFNTTLTWFFSRNSDMIALYPRTDGISGNRFGNSPDNLDVAGWELEVAAEPMEGVWLRAGYSYLYKAEQDPQRFPTHSGSLIVNYRSGDWNLNLSGHYRGKVEHEYLGESLWLDDYWHLNTSLRYQLTERLTLSATLRNLLDEAYGSPMRNFPQPDGLPVRGRMLALEVDYAFGR